MDLDALTAFHDAARLGSFAAVARARGVAPSSITRQVQAVEAALGVALFHRSTRQLTLTDAGGAYLERTAPLLAELNAAAAEAKDRERGIAGTLRVSASIAFGQAVLVPLLPTLLEAYPSLSVDLVLTDQLVDLVNERVDVALRLTEPVGAALIQRKLKGVRFHIVASPDYLEQKGIPQTPKDLSGHSCLRFPFPGFRDEWQFTKGEKTLSIPIEGRIVASSALALRALCLGSGGPALLADWMITDDLAAGSLVDLFPEHHVTGDPAAAGLWAVFPSRHYRPRKVEVFLEALSNAATTPAAR